MSHRILKDSQTHNILKMPKEKRRLKDSNTEVVLTFTEKIFSNSLSKRTSDKKKKTRSFNSVKDMISFLQNPRCISSNAPFGDDDWTITTNAKPYFVSATINGTKYVSWNKVMKLV